MVTDFVFPPRLFPGSESFDSKEWFGFDDVYAQIRWLIQHLRSAVVSLLQMNVDVTPYGKIGRLVAQLVGAITKPIAAIVACSMMIAVVTLTISPAFLYRWALKSTAALWLPLFLIGIQARPGAEIMVRLKVIRYSAWTNAMLFVSTLVLLIFVAKLALLLGIWHLANLDWLGPLGVVATRLVAPLELPVWQIAGATNALLAWLFYFHADQHLLLQGKREAWQEVWVRREYVFFQVARTTLTLYVIACTFYIAATVAWQTEWPPIRFVLFPSA